MACWLDSNVHCPWITQNLLLSLLYTNVIFFFIGISYVELRHLKTYYLKICILSIVYISISIYTKDIYTIYKKITQMLSFFYWNKLYWVKTYCLYMCITTMCILYVCVYIHIVPGIFGSSVYLWKIPMLCVWLVNCCMCLCSIPLWLSQSLSPYFYATSLGYVLETHLFWNLFLLSFKVFEKPWCKYSSVCVLEDTNCF